MQSDEIENTFSIVSSLLVSKHPGRWILVAIEVSTADFYIGLDVLGG